MVTMVEEPTKLSRTLSSSREMKDLARDIVLYTGSVVLRVENSFSSPALFALTLGVEGQVV